MMRQGYQTRPNTKLLPTDARAHNRTLVLHTILRTPDISRADVARITGLSRITVSELVSGLVTDGLVVEMGSRESAGRPGKPATLLQVNPRAFAVIAVDLSQPRRFHGAALALDGAILHQAELVGDFRGESAVTALVNLIARLTTAAHLPIGGIGIGSPGIVDDSGIVVESTNLRWHHLPLASIVAQRFNAPTLVENDANAAISAELDPDEPGDLFLVRIGAGIGGAAVVNGRLVRGANNAGGELGHIVAYPASESAVTVEESVQELLRRAQSLRRGSGDEADIRAEVTDINRRIGTLLGESMTSAVSMLDIPEVVIEGPRELDLQTIADAAEEAMTHQRRLVFDRRCRVRPGRHGEDVVIRGMADLVLARTLSST